MGMAGRPLGGRAPAAPVACGAGLAAMEDGAAQLAAEMAELAAVHEVMGRIHAAQRGHVPWRVVPQPAVVLRPNDPASRNREEQERRLLQEVEAFLTRNPRIIPRHADRAIVPNTTQPMFVHPNLWDFGQPLPTLFYPGEARDDNTPFGGLPRAFLPPAHPFPLRQPQVYLGREQVAEPALPAASPLPTYRIRRVRPAPHATAAAAAPDAQFAVPHRPVAPAFPAFYNPPPRPALPDRMPSQHSQPHDLPTVDFNGQAYPDVAWDTLQALVFL
jgi:hypothetical protein